MTLLEALTEARKAGALVPQVQGDCGIFSFWYATVLLRYCGDKRPAIYPRKHPRPGIPWADGAQPEVSIREWAKKNLRSGQGEVLTTAEMKEMVFAHGYMPIGCSQPGAIGDLVGMNHPVLVCYSISGGLPETHPTGPHAHWSLIVDTRGQDCLVLNPHNPGHDNWWPLATLLASNQAVDDYSYERYWYKRHAGDLVSETALRQALGLGSTNPIPASAYEKRYDIGQDGRSQELKGALIGVG